MNLNFEKQDGLVSAVIQDAASLRVLMVGSMNPEAFALTRDTGFVTLFSRTRQRLWTKGESSGHKLVVRRIELDCDADTVLVHVDPVGPGVCHEGYASCFFRTWRDGEWVVSEERTYDPASVYGGAQ